MIGASLAAVLVASSIRYGVAAMSTAGSETASSMPWASVIEPRRGGTPLVAPRWGPDGRRRLGHGGALERAGLDHAEPGRLDGAEGQEGEKGGEQEADAPLD